MANRFLSNIRINDAYTFPASDGTNNQVIKTDGSGNLSFGQLAADSASVMYKDTFTGDGSTSVFSLANALNDEVQSNIYIDGVYQSKSTYSVSGTAITFSTAPLSGHEIEVISTTGINSGPTAIYTDTFTANGSATAFTLGQTVHSENQTIVFLNGVYQFKDTYTLSGTTLTLDTAPANGVSIEVMSIGSAYSGGDILYDHDFTSAGLMTTNGSGVYSITTNNSANWNTAYGWGDHSTQSYATQSYVGTQISNLVDSSPATLDTLNELAAALGDDPNFATTTATSIGTKLPLAGGTLTGNVLIGNTVTNPASGFGDQTGIGLKYSTTVPELQVSSDSTAMQLGRTTTGGHGQIMALRYASNTIHSFDTNNVSIGTNATFAGTVLIDGVSNYTGLEVKGAGASRPQIKFSNVNQGTLAQIYGTESNSLVTTVPAGLEYQVRNANGAGGDHVFKSYNTAILTLDGGTNNATFAGKISSVKELINVNSANGIRSGGFEVQDNGDLFIGTATTAGNIVLETGNSTNGLPSTGTARLTVNSTGATFAGDVMPAAENAHNIGSAAVRWEDLYVDDGYIRNAYIDEYIYHNGETTNNISFTTGNFNVTVGGNLKFNVDVNNTYFPQNNVIISSGSVGIGTTSPGTFYPGNHNLVVGDGNADSAITVYANPANTSYLLFADGTSGNSTYTAQVRYNHSTNHMEFATNNSTTAKMTLDDTGNVGIGTTSPDITGFGYKTLTVVGGTSAGYAGVLELGSPTTNANGQNLGIIAFMDGSTRNAQIDVTRASSTSTSNMQFYTNGGSGIEERMRIFSNGNVNIGVAEAGSSAVTGPFVVTHTSSRFLTSSYEESAVSLSAKNGNNNLETLRLAGDSIKFFNGTNAVGSQKMVILNNGNVGIGTTTPANKFVVRDTGSGFNSTIQTSTVSIISKEMTDNAYHSILQLVAVRQSLVAGNASNGYLGFSTVDDSNNQGQLDAGRIAIVNEAGSSRNSATALSFWTNPGGTQTTAAVEKMRINSAGFLKASNNGSYDNATSTVHELVSNSNGGQIAKFTHKGTVPYGMQIRYSQVSPNTTDNYFFIGSDSTANRIIIWGNGNVQNQNNSYGALSDIKLKENIVDATPKLDDLIKVKIRNYNLIGQEDKQIGVIAQELEEVFPAMIDESIDFEEKEVTDEEGNVSTEKIDLGTTTKSVKYSVFVPMLIKAIQELKADNDSLKARIETLENN